MNSTQKIMTIGEFWNSIEVSRVAAKENTAARVAALDKHLTGLTLEEIQGFQHQCDQMTHVANRWDLWGAAYER